MTRYFPIALCLSTLALANPPLLTNKALRVDAPYDLFAKCVAQAAIDQVLSNNPWTKGFAFQTLGIAELEGESPPYTSVATLSFFTVSPQGTHQVIDVTLRSLDSGGWQMIQGSTGSVYPYSSSVDAVGYVSQEGSSPIGPADLSGCN